VCSGYFSCVLVPTRLVGRLLLLISISNRSFNIGKWGREGYFEREAMSATGRAVHHVGWCLTSPGKPDAARGPKFGAQSAHRSFPSQRELHWALRQLSSSQTGTDRVIFRCCWGSVRSSTPASQLLIALVISVIPGQTGAFDEGCHRVAIPTFPRFRAPSAASRDGETWQPNHSQAGQPRTGAQPARQ
jgi:hypothetical protein